MTRVGRDWDNMMEDDIRRYYGCEGDVAVDNVSFGRVLELMKSNPARKFARKGWNGKGIYIQLQVPDEHSKMTLPYIYIVTNSLITDNPDAPKGVVPWLASQTDMLAEDWMQVFYD